MQPSLAALRTLTLFASLRLDEINKIARRLEYLKLACGQEHAIGETAREARLVVVLSGITDVISEDPTGEIRERMRAGDRYGDALLLSGRPRRVRLVARRSSEIALLDRDALESVLVDYPAIALPLAEELASELRARNDQVRQALELAASGLGPRQTEVELRRLRQSWILRSVAVRRTAIGGLFRRLVIDRGAEPPFWMLLGFLVSLAAARLTVYLILRYKLEKQLFALVAGVDPNPVHIHHFNYGLLVIAAVGIFALSQLGRRALRTLAFLFGIGCGLVFDEFALFWNLNPDYSQGLSLISSAIVAVLLIQLTYFRHFWAALLTRGAQGL